MTVRPSSLGQPAMEPATRARIRTLAQQELVGKAAELALAPPVSRTGRPVPGSCLQRKCDPRPAACTPWQPVASGAGGGGSAIGAASLEAVVIAALEEGVDDLMEVRMPGL